jgi:hypothetical protein
VALVFASEPKNLPAAQSVQTGAPSSEYFPAAQSVQTAAPAEYFPATQFVQTSLVVPTAAWYFPAAQR